MTYQPFVGVAVRVEPNGCSARVDKIGSSLVQINLVRRSGPGWDHSSNAGRLARGARQATIRYGLGNMVYIAGIGIAFDSAPASLALVGLVAVYYSFEQMPVRRPPVSGPASSSAVRWSS
jgi:hypothetical protein